MSLSEKTSALDARSNNAIFIHNRPTLAPIHIHLRIPHKTKSRRRLQFNTKQLKIYFTSSLFT